ncbi:MAG: rhomboid family intramembrane serine protease [Polyangiaceae bacterium]|nr:rhomboid family intramembrane serine protease [Polyangiaceae bacterium]
MPFWSQLGRGARALIVVIGVLGLLTAISFNLMRSDVLFTGLVSSGDKVFAGQVWRLFTAQFLTSPVSLGHLLFTLLGLVFLSGDLERTWGTRRFVAFFVATNLASALASALVDRFVPGGGAVLHPPLVFGAGASLAAIAIAWGNMHSNASIRLFFVLPVAGKHLIWITVLLSTLGCIYPGSTTEGPVAILFGCLVGLLFGGKPSPARRMFLEAKLGYLGRRSSRIVASSRETVSKKGSLIRPAPPALRVVKGGKEDDDKKRYLN